MIPEYRIKTVADFLAVPDDRLTDCLADFREFLVLAKRASEVASYLQGALDVPESSLTLITDQFHWRDDGRHGCVAVDFWAADGAALGRLDLSPGTSTEAGE